METRAKILIGAAVLIVLAAMAWIIKQQNDIIKRQSQIEHDIVEFKQLGNGIVRLESKYVQDSKDLENNLKKLGVDVDKIKADMDDQKARLDKIAVVMGSTPGSSGTGVSSSFSEPIKKKQQNPEPIPGQSPQQQVVATCLSEFGYCDNVQGLKLTEPTGVGSEAIPVGTVRFNSTQKDPWTFNIYPRKYYSVLSIGRDTSGRSIAYAKMMVEASTGDGKAPVKYSVGINQAYLNEVLEPSRIYWWNPRLMAGWTPGVSMNAEFSSIFSLQFFTSAYASNRSRPRWSFLGLGFGYDAARSQFSTLVTPVAYNLLPKTDLIQNVYVGPSVGFSLTDISVGATLGFML